MIRSSSDPPLKYRMVDQIPSSSSSSPASSYFSFNPFSLPFTQPSFHRYPSLCGDADDDLRPYPQLFNSNSTDSPSSSELSIPCSLFWTLHFCLTVNVLKSSRTECDALRDSLVDEIRRHRATLSSLDVMRSKLDGYIWELDMARHKADTEKGRCQEAYKIVEQVTKRLKEESIHKRKWEKRAMEESRRRKEAEEGWERKVKEMREEEEQRLEEMERRLRKDAEERLEEMEKRVSEERKLRMEAERRELEERRKRREALKRAVVEYSAEELRCATGSFDEENKVQEDGYGALYKGKCGNVPVYIRVLEEDYLLSELEEEEQSRSMIFIREVISLSRIHHPHILTFLGACFDDKPCLVYEHMANGSLAHYLSNNGGAPLPWHARFRICSEIASALLFLHSLPSPLPHGQLNLQNVFLTHNLACKIGDVGISQLLLLCNGEIENRPNQESDLRALGIIVLQLLTGLPADGVVEDVDEAIDRNKLQDILDDSAGEWPFVETMELACLSLQFAEQRSNQRDLMQMMEIMERIRECVEENSENERLKVIPSQSEECPHYFLCPITQEIMENPCIAADGFCYERQQIQTWLQNHNTSPMTNTLLDHQNLTPNNSLRSAIQEWTEKQQQQQHQRGS